jgi:F-type H+-transporting ATPase subunit epsilon
MALRCVVTTPERTQLNEEVRSVVLPMVDGQLGVLPGRAPMVGRLGYGLLIYETSSGNKELFVDGGFVQVEGDLVSVLTSRALPPSAIDVTSAEKSMAEALGMAGGSPGATLLRDTAVRRARGQLRVAKRSK